MTGGIIEMRLMKRERNSLFAVPVSHPGLPTHPSLQDTPQNQALGKIIKVVRHLFRPLGDTETNKILSNKLLQKTMSRVRLSENR